MDTTKIATTQEQRDNMRYIITELKRRSQIFTKEYLKVVDEKTLGYRIPIHVTSIFYAISSINEENLVPSVLVDFLYNKNKPNTRRFTIFNMESDIDALWDSIATTYALQAKSYGIVEGFFFISEELYK